jgi:hypothetical protein
MAGDVVPGDAGCEVLDMMDLLPVSCVSYRSIIAQKFGKSDTLFGRSSKIAKTRFFGNGRWGEDGEAGVGVCVFAEGVVYWLGC